MVSDSSDGLRFFLILGASLFGIVFRIVRVLIRTSARRIACGSVRDPGNSLQLSIFHGQGIEGFFVIGLKDSPVAHIAVSLRVAIEAVHSCIDQHLHNF